MDHLGQQALAGARFAFEHDRGVGVNDIVQDVGHFQDLGRAAHDLGQVTPHLQGELGLLAAHAFGDQVFVQAPDPQHHPDAAEHGLDVNRFGHVVFGANLQGLDGRVFFVEGRKHHNRHVAEFAVTFYALPVLPNR